MTCPDCGAEAKFDPVDAVGWFEHTLACQQRIRPVTHAHASEHGAQCTRRRWDQPDCWCSLEN